MDYNVLDFFFIIQALLYNKYCHEKMGGYMIVTIRIWGEYRVVHVTSQQ